MTTSVIADFVHAHGEEMDAVIEPILLLDEPLTIEALIAIVTARGEPLDLLRGVTSSKKTPRSFAAKYLHFHNPIVLIYDEYVRIALTKLVRWDSSHLPFPRPRLLTPSTTSSAFASAVSMRHVRTMVFR